MRAFLSREWSHPSLSFDRRVNRAVDQFWIEHVLSFDHILSAVSNEGFCLCNYNPTF